MAISSLNPVQKLGQGARVALVAPAGALRDESDLERATANAQSLGWEPAVGENVMRRAGYLAGTDEQRLSDLNRAITDPKTDAIWCIRGGYGMMRLLSGVNYEAFIKHPKPVIGFSDVTALLCALGKLTRTVTYHGPTARCNLTTFTRDSLVKAVVNCEDSCGVAQEAEVIRDGNAEGALSGGNLALLAALCGTPYQPDFNNCIVVLEDINEPVYRVDRMLQQIFLSGAFKGCKAIIFGSCTACGGGSGGARSGVNATDAERGINSVLQELASHLKVPCMFGVPVGHIDDQWTLPFGALAVVSTDAKTLTVVRN